MIVTQTFFPEQETHSISGYWTETTPVRFTGSVWWTLTAERISIP